MVPGRVTLQRGCPRTLMLFGSHARYLWILDSFNILVCFCVNLGLGATFWTAWFYFDNSLSPSLKAGLFMWQCLLPIVSILVSVGNLFAYFKPRWFFYSRLPALHPMYTMVISLIMLIAWALQGIGYWEGPHEYGIRGGRFRNSKDFALSKDDPDQFIKAKTVTAVCFFCLWLYYFAVSVAAVAVLKFRKQAAIQSDTEAPIELNTRAESSNEPGLTDTTNDETTPEAPHRAPAFERTGASADTGLTFMS